MPANPLNPHDDIGMASVGCDFKQQGIGGKAGFRLFDAKHFAV